MKRENFLKLGYDAILGEHPGRPSGTVVGWNRLALQAIRNAQPGPQAAARALAILHTCMYNAWAAYDDNARQTAHGVAVRLPCAERIAVGKARAMSHAAHAALKGQFPAQRALFDAWMAALELDPGAGGGPLSPPGIGRIQAAALLDFFRRQEHAPPAGASAPGLEPIPARWCLPAHRLSERDGYGDDQDVRLFFALANAIQDAAIAGWGGAQGSVGAAVAEVVRRFAGGAMRGDAPAGQELGRKLGARAFDGARRHWEGRL